MLTRSNRALEDGLSTGRCYFLPQTWCPAFLLSPRRARTGGGARDRPSGVGANAAMLEGRSWVALTSHKSSSGAKLYLVVEAFKCKKPSKTQFCLFSGTNTKKTAEVENAEWEIQDSH